MIGWQSARRAGETKAQSTERYADLNSNNGVLQQKDVALRAVFGIRLHFESVGCDAVGTRMRPIYKQHQVACFQMIFR